MFHRIIYTFNKYNDSRLENAQQQMKRDMEKFKFLNKQDETKEI